MATRSELIQLLIIDAELYDFAKYYLYTNFAGQTATYITGTGRCGFLQHNHQSICSKSFYSKWFVFSY
jgi:hypothetical protein